VLYDRRVKLIMSGRGAAESCTPKARWRTSFPRTVSRLREMQIAEFLACARRNVGLRR
jgi:cell division protein ZapE